MKKVIVIASLLAAALCSANAQGLKDKLDELGELGEANSVVKSGDDKFKIDVLTHFRFGDHFVKAAEGIPVTDKKSGEFAMGIIEMSYQAADWVALKAGLDCKWDRVAASKGHVFTLTNDGKFDMVAGNAKKSFAKVFSLTTPVTLNFSYEKLGINIGGEANFAIRSRSKTVLKGEEKELAGKSKIVKKGGKPDTINWNWLVEFMYDDVGLYFRYCPKPIIDKYFDITCNTLGLVVYF